jgi:glycerol-3-phosphate dehydrogenase
MRRDLKKLSETTYDLLIIGGGAYGACSAWDAALRGLSVALIEKGDFAHATSSNSLKIIHGGLRYLQHADFRRMRQSIRERSVLLRIAPHLIRPLPFLIPTYGHTLRGKEVMSIALRLNDLIGFDRNRGQDAGRQLPASRVISREEYLRIVPGVDREGLTGGAIWYDAQVLNSERLILSFLHSAVQAGAEVANYVEASGFLTEGKRVIGVRARDTLTGDSFDVRARVVLNTTGPWVGRVVELLEGKTPEASLPLSKAMNLVIRRKLFPDYAVGIWSKHEFKDHDAVLNKGSRLLFITPWREYSLVGTTHTHYDGDPDGFRVTEAEIQEFLDEINEAYPEAAIKREEVTFFYGGLLPADAKSGTNGDVTLLKQYRIFDHLETEGIEGLVSVVSVKLTTARDVAQKAVDVVFKKLNWTPPKCRTAETPVYGGQIEDLTDFLSQQARLHGERVPPGVIHHLVHTYGSALGDVMKYAEETPEGNATLSEDSNVIRAEVLHGVREEMAQKLADVVMRRTELGTAGFPGEASLQSCADILAEELGWNRQRRNDEIAEVKALFRAAG